MESDGYEAVSGQCAGTESATSQAGSGEAIEMAALRDSNQGGLRAGAGRPRQHALPKLRKTLRTLTTQRLVGRSALAVAVRTWKAEVRRDLGGDLSRAQETILEAAAQSWVILSSLDDYIARQTSIVTKKRALLPVVRERMQVAEGLAKQLDRLGLERRARNVPDLTTCLASKAPGGPATPASEPAPVQPTSGLRHSGDDPLPVDHADGDVATPLGSANETLEVVTCPFGP